MKIKKNMITDLVFFLVIRRNNARAARRLLDAHAHLRMHLEDWKDWKIVDWKLEERKMIKNFKFPEIFNNLYSNSKTRVVWSMLIYSG